MRLGDWQQMYEAMDAAYAQLRDLQKQRAYVQSRIPMLQQQVATRTEAVSVAEKAQREAVEQHVRGIGTDVALAEARATLGHAIAARNETAAELEVSSGAGNAIKVLDAEIYTATKAAMRARQLAFNAVIDGIATVLRSDEKIEAMLRLIYAAYLEMPDASVELFGGQLDWGAVLADVFPAPDAAQRERAIAEFGKKYSLPKFAAAA